MTVAKRQFYLDKLIEKQNNGLVKVITGLRRVGKSYLLFTLYKKYLIESGIKSENIICIQLDDNSFLKLRNPLILSDFINSKITSDEQYFVFIDEIQFCKKIKNPYLEDDFIGFYEVLNGLLHMSNVDTYVTGSNSKMLTTDVLTEFRGRGDEIHVMPLTFAEYYEACEKDYEDALTDYMMFGGMPRLLHLQSDSEKMNYLKSLFNEIYLKDISERNSLRNTHELDILVNVLASGIGSFTNPTKISNTFKTELKLSYDIKTIANHIKFLKEAFVVFEAKRYNIKGRKYIGANSKYYFSDIGLRNARIGFRQQEMPHIMENLIYTELIARGLLVDVGIVEVNKKNENGSNVKKQLEVDFVAKTVHKTYYIQSAYRIDSEEKNMQEIASLKNIKDSFQKIIVHYDRMHEYYDENGFLNICLKDFLLNRGEINHERTERTF